MWKLTLQNEREFKRLLYTEFASDNFSERADAWNDERQKVLDKALTKLDSVITRGVKESLRTACQDELLKVWSGGVLQAARPGTVQAQGTGFGHNPPRARPVQRHGRRRAGPGPLAWVEEDGRVLEHGKFINLGRDRRRETPSSSWSSAGGQTLSAWAGSSPTPTGSSGSSRA